MIRPVSGTTNAGTDFGQVSATSTATVSGTLAIQTAAAFTPPDGTAYQVVKGSSVTGTFSSVTGATLPDRKYVLTYNANNVTANVHYFPTVSGVSPTSGPAAGSNTVTITGQHFQATSATGAATGVSFGGVAATSFTIVDDSHITATVPAGSAGTVDVTVTGPFGTSPTSSADQYTYLPAPSVSGVSPSSGPATGATNVTVTGAHFSGATSVKFGSTAATNVLVVDDGHITATAPAGTGTVDVTVTTPGGTSATSSSDQFTYQSSGAPAVTGLNPAAGSTKGNTVVHVTGSGFTGATAVTFGGTAGTKLRVVDAGHITVTAPKRAMGSVDVRVTTPAGTSPINQPADVFTYYNPPTVASITSPADAPLAGGNTVQVKGTNFVVGQTSVKFGSTAGANVQVSSSTVLTVVAPATPTAGSVDITVTSPGGPSAKSLKDLYAYGAPAVSSFTPASGITGSTVTITGSGFAAGVTVSFGTFKSSSVKILSGTSLTATVPNGDTVASTITASDPQGSGASPTQFTPTMGIKSFSPTSGSISAGTLVTITGVGFSADSVAAFNSVNAQTTFVDSQHLKAAVPAGSSTGFLTVTSPGTDNLSGTVTSKSKFTVNP
jgi:IPT/TIG domain